MENCKKLIRKVDRRYYSQAYQLVVECRKGMGNAKTEKETDIWFETSKQVGEALKLAANAQSEPDSVDEALQTAQRMLIHAVRDDLVLTKRLKETINESRKRDAECSDRQKSVVERLKSTVKSAFIEEIKVEVRLRKRTPETTSDMLPMTVGRSAGLDGLLFMLVQKKRVTLHENPHFYQDLPPSYDDASKHQPIKKLGPPRFPLVVYVLVEGARRVFLQSKSLSVAFGNIWKTRDVILLKEANGTLLSAKKVQEEYIPAYSNVFVEELTNWYSSKEPVLSFDCEASSRTSFTLRSSIAQSSAASSTLFNASTETLSSYTTCVGNVGGTATPSHETASPDANTTIPVENMVDLIRQHAALLPGAAASGNHSQHFSEDNTPSSTMTSDDASRQLGVTPEHNHEASDSNSNTRMMPASDELPSDGQRLSPGSLPQVSSQDIPDTRNLSRGATAGGRPISVISYPAPPYDSNHDVAPNAATIGAVPTLDRLHSASSANPPSPKMRQPALDQKPSGTSMIPDLTSSGNSHQRPSQNTSRKFDEGPPLLPPSLSKPTTSSANRPKQSWFRRAWHSIAG